MTFSRKNLLILIIHKKTYNSFKICKCAESKGNNKTLDILDFYDIMFFIKLYNFYEVDYMLSLLKKS